MMFAASDTMNSLADTAICRCSEVFRLSSAAYIDWVNARSFVALGATRATFRIFVDDDPGLVEVVVFEPLLPQAAVASAIPTAATSNVILRVRCVRISVSSLSIGACPCRARVGDRAGLNLLSRRACRERPADGIGGRPAATPGW